MIKLAPLLPNWHEVHQLMNNVQGLEEQENELVLIGGLGLAGINHTL